jgi:hypothetical protein
MFPHQFVNFFDQIWILLQFYVVILKNKFELSLEDI